MNIKQYSTKIRSYLFDVREAREVPQSRINKLTEKIPLVMAMFVSSVLVGISTYNTFPSENELLRMSSAVIGGLAFDVILSSTVFSKRKNAYSIATILAALVTGLAIALDLYMKLELTWLHATYIFMATLYALHSATTRLEPSVTLARPASYPRPTRASLEPARPARPTPASEPASYPGVCPACSTSLPNKQALASARKLGYCKACKG